MSDEDEGGAGWTLTDEGYVSPRGSFEGRCSLRQYQHYQRFGIFLDGRSWSEQRISLLAEMELLAKAQELNSKGFDEYTVGERDFIVWLNEE